MKTLICLVIYCFTICVNAQEEKEHTDNDHSIAIPNSEAKENVELKHLEYNDVTLILQDTPKYTGGENAFIRKIEDGIDVSLLKEVPSGKYRVFVSFIIGEDGMMSEKKILRDPGYGLGMQVLTRLNELNDKWSPGIKDDKPIAVRYNLPITVKVP